MISLDSELYRKLIEKIEALRQTKVTAFINGHITKETLDREGGYLRALLDIEAIIEDAHKEMKN